VEVFKIFKDVIQVEEALFENVGFVRQVQDRLRNCRDCLAGCVGWKVDGQIGQAEDAHERHEAFLKNEFSAVVVGRVVGQDGVDKLHDVVDVVDERDRLLFGGGRGRTRFLRLGGRILLRILSSVSGFLFVVFFLVGASALRIGRLLNLKKK
jgi:hypothetical protein